MPQIDMKYVEGLARWSKPQEVQTKYGPRILRKAEPTNEFSAAWKEHKDAIKALGAGFGKNLNDAWELVWWQTLVPEVIKERQKAFEESKATSADIALPAPDGLDYMPFQKAGIRYALARTNVLLADGMGLGKTIEAIGVINSDESIDSVLVVCPKSLKLNWLRECQRWLVRKLDVAVADKVWPETDIVILNYEALSQGKFDAFVQDRHWGLLILDEVHYCKNLSTKRADACFNAAQLSRRVLGLTGTPICNRPSELVGILSVIKSMDVFGGKSAFLRRYAGAYYNGFGYNTGGASRLDELQRRLRENVMVRRLKDDVLKELPRKIRQIVEVEAETPEQAAAVLAERHYEEGSEDRLAELRTLVELSKAESDEAYQAAVMRLREAETVDFTEMSRLRHKTAMAKVPAVVSHVKLALDDDDGKIFIAAHHHDVIDALMEALAEYNPVKLTGEMHNEATRQQSIDAFQNDPRVRVFVGSIQAAGVGITLTASSHAVFAELDWVPGNITQCEDRLHRIGQTQTVLVQHIVLQDSLDARMAQTLVHKQRIIDEALDNEHPERKMPAYEPRKKAATQNTKVDELAAIAAKLTADQMAVVHNALQYLAGNDADMAMSKNDIGFNKIDSGIGHSLAAMQSLTPKQAALGAKLLRKYKGQLDNETNITLETIKA